MTKYVGLTDDPERRKREHGNPLDWWEYRFETEQQARRWERNMLAREGFVGQPGGRGWHYGYVYTITEQTDQETEKGTE
ncbi:MAG: hypothetical protein MJA83_14955 [Gammaproteobacteria bacterium]|nr:hypothetical protein [Gammaproteobacteria bacterium]